MLAEQRLQERVVHIVDPAARGKVGEDGGFAERVEGEPGVSGELRGDNEAR